MNKKKTPKVLKTHKFELGGVEYDEKLKEYKSVKLDGVEIYRIDRTVYMGVKKDYTLDVLKILSEKLGIEVTKDDLQKAILFGTIEGY